MSEKVTVILRYLNGGVLETKEDAALLGTIITCRGRTFTYASFGAGRATYLEFVGAPHELSCEAVSA